MKKKSIILADGHKKFRESLVRLINSEKDLHVVAEAGNGAEAIELVKSLEPDVAVFDITMPEVSGLDAVRLLLKKELRTKFIMLTMLEEQEINHDGVSQGISGCILKEDSFELLINSIRETLSGKVFILPLMSDRVHEMENVKEPINGKISMLTLLSPREIDVLSCLSKSMTSREIGKELQISHRTVQLHRANIMRKLNIQGRNQLLTFALTNVKNLSKITN